MVTIFENQLNIALEEYRKVEKKLERLDNLKRGRVKEEYEGEKVELEGKEEELEKEKKDKWKHVEYLMCKKKIYKKIILHSFHFVYLFI